MKQRYNISVPLTAIAYALAILYTVLFLCILPFSRQTVARRDFIVYWATGRQLVHRGNPYDAAALNQIEHAAGFSGGASYYMRNAPWALPLALPLGFVGPMAAALPWSLLMLGLLIASVRILWKLFGGPRNSPENSLVWLGYCFPPALWCVLLGQTSIFLLFGFTLFLRFHKTRPFAAGAALWLCSIKPHLFLPFAVVLLLWIFVARAWRILWGAAAAFAAGALITTCIDPAAWGQYAYYMRTSVVTREFTPCLADLLRDSIRPTAEWLAFVPVAAGCLWALAWFWPRRNDWDWLEQGSLLVLVSLLVAPFGWIFDQSLALPAVLWGASRTSSQLLLSALALIYIAVELQLVHFDLHSTAWLWTTPAWLAWYLFARAARPEPRMMTMPASPSPSVSSSS